MKIFGIGSGRCGTTTLSMILSHQESIQIPHEFEHTPFNWENNKVDFDSMVSMIEDNGWNGAIALYLINYIENFIERYGIEETKIIVVQRDKDATVNSFLKWTSTPQRNFWINSKDSSIYQKDRWDKSFPSYDPSMSKESMIGKYYDEYYDKTYQIMQKYPDQTYYIKTEEFNDPEKIKDLLKWVGIQNPRIPAKLRYNAS